MRYSEVLKYNYSCACAKYVIGKKDENRFIQNLSKYQQKNLEMKYVDENFKFGPSGPYKCDKKLRFPITDGMEDLMVEVALVNADILMLLGNNIFKPLGAHIDIFSSGNVILKLADR